MPQKTSLPPSGIRLGETSSASSAPEPESKGPSRRGAVLRWGGTAALCLVAVTGLVGVTAAGDFSAQALAPGFKQAGIQEDRIASAEAALESLPSEAVAKRQFEDVSRLAQQAAELQQVLDAHGPVETRDEYDNPIPADERESQADADSRAHGEATSTLASLFDDSAKAPSWAAGTETEPDTQWFGSPASESGRQWRAVPSASFDASGRIPVSWILRDADGALLATATSDYDAAKGKLSSPVISLTDAGRTVVEAEEEAARQAARDEDGVQG